MPAFPTVCPGPLPRLKPGCGLFCLFYIAIRTGLLCPQLLILLYLPGPNLMTRNPKQIKFALKTQGDQ